MPHLKVSLIAIAVISIAGLIILSSSYTRKENNFPENSAALISLKNSKLIGSDRGSKIWSLKAESIEVSQDNSTTTLKNISDGIIFDSRSPAVKLKAGIIILNNTTNNFEISNGLDAVSENMQSFHCQNAYWSYNKHTLTSRSPVIFNSTNMNIKASRMQINTQLKEMKLWNSKLEIKL